MTRRTPIAHRSDFSVRCVCGIEYRSDDSHLGKQLQCRCGRTVTIARPLDEYVVPEEHKKVHRRKRAHHAGAKVYGLTSRSFADRLAAIPSNFVSGTRDWVVESWTDMGSYRTSRRWSSRLAWTWFAFVVVTWLLLIMTSESFLPATLLAYGPRFVLLAPFLLLVPLALFAARSAFLPLALALLVILGPIMGGRVSWRTIGRSLPPSPADAATPQTFRVLTFNTQGGGHVAVRLRDAFERTHPDLVAFQECGDALFDSLRAIPQLAARRHESLCMGSRWPVIAEDSMPRAAFERIRKLGAGGAALAIRYTLQTPHGPLTFVNLHLETARKGLETLMGNDGFIPDGLEARDPQAAPPAGRLDLNAEIRNRESERAAVWSLQGDKSKPVLVVGDFNLPVESAIFRRHWGDFTDAFEATGTGFGFSKQEGELLHIRIDHILGNATAPRPIGTWLGPDLGSDHLPVIADMRWAKK